MKRAILSTVVVLLATRTALTAEEAYFAPEVEPKEVLAYFVGSWTGEVTRGNTTFKTKLSWTWDLNETVIVGRSTIPPDPTTLQIEIMGWDGSAKVFRGSSFHRDQAHWNSCRRVSKNGDFFVLEDTGSGYLGDMKAWLESTLTVKDQNHYTRSLSAN